MEPELNLVLENYSLDAVTFRMTPLVWYGRGPAKLQNETSPNTLKAPIDIL